MVVKTEAMPRPVKYVVTVDAEDLDSRKKKAYDAIKHEIQVQGFRKGTVPQDVAEARLGPEKLYKSVIDGIYKEVVKSEPIVSSHDFAFYGDLKRSTSLTIEFVADVRPEVKLVSIDEVANKVKLEDSDVTEDDLKERIKLEIKQLEVVQDSQKDVLSNFDIAVIDFEGKVVGQSNPFKGGTAKGYQITVNELVNGKKQFVDNFEDQLVGMKIGETRLISVKFPQDYREVSLAGKDVVFEVVLKAIKDRILSEYNEEFAKKKGFESLQLFEEHLNRSILQTKKNSAVEAFKKSMLSTMSSLSEISPIPSVMIENENEKEWNSFLRRIGKKEEQLAKENVTKEMFFANNSGRSLEFIKATLVLEEAAKNNNIVVSEDEVVQYTLRITKTLNYGTSREEKVKKDLKENKHQYKLMEIATRNEKTIDFLYSMLTEKIV